MQGDPVAWALSGNALELYYEVGDPYSQLCAAFARSLLPQLDCPLRILLVPAPVASAYPEEPRQRRFAATDATRLAACYGLPAPIEVPSSQQEAFGVCLNRVGQDAAAFLAMEQDCLTKVAAQQALPVPTDTELLELKQSQETNARRRERLGHYLSAMWQYQGEWFWALDRLNFLLRRLQTRQAVKEGTVSINFQSSQLPVSAPAANTPLEFWFNFRSPYSYLAAVELLRRRARGRAPHLVIRPVLPVMMKGVSMPLKKMLYIARDAKRCADDLNIPFGCISDPVGRGVRRLLTLYPTEASVDEQLRYCVVAGQTIWSDGLDVRRDDVLQEVIERAGMDWPSAQARLASGYETNFAEENDKALHDIGLWGVPSFRCGNEFSTWGQDRLWMVDEVLSRQESL